jgi:Uma2 family endonuclease
MCSAIVAYREHRSAQHLALECSLVANTAAVLDELAHTNVRVCCYLVLVMSNPARRRATYQDVLDAPPDKIAEIIHGELHLSSRPRYKHSSVAKALNALLTLPFDMGIGGPGDWIILYEPELHLGDEILVPDLAGWRCERLPVVEDVAFETLAPDWLCEILSRSTEKVDRIDKMPTYAAHGVKHVWLAHPIRRTLEVFRLQVGRWLTVATHQDDQRVRAEPFEELELDLSLLWRKLAPSPPRRDRASEPTATYEPSGTYEPEEYETY